MLARIKVVIMVLLYAMRETPAPFSLIWREGALWPVFEVMRHVPWLVLGILCLGCGKADPPEPETGRNTPLNEEVDEVAKVRDEALD